MPGVTASAGHGGKREEGRGRAMTDEIARPRFQGFTGPNYTQVPDEPFDELLPELSGAELKLSLHTDGSQMARGLTANVSLEWDDIHLAYCTLQ
jgi:hypothetical protein